METRRLNTWRRIAHLVPDKRLLWALLALAALNIALVLVAELNSTDLAPQAHWLLNIASGVVIFAALVDAWRLCQEPNPTAERLMPQSVAVGRDFSITLVLSHHLNRRLHLQLHDDLPGAIATAAMPAAVVLQPGATSEVTYVARALERGPLQLSRCVVRLPSQWQLWRRDAWLPAAASAKVYPDFSAIAAYSVLATDNHVSQLGIMKKARRGQGTEFHQLREYRRGDSLRQVDWKATSRRHKIISRDYADERDQQVVLLIDSGRRMRAKDGDLSHYDHALNSLLLVSYIALRQGDSVSVMSLGANARWIPPQKGPNKSTVILNGLYDLSPDNTAPDYVAAAERLGRLQSKRSLVVLISNCRDEDVDELALALQSLRKRHLVLVANLREQALDDALREAPVKFDQALQYAGTRQYLAARERVQKQLNSRGILTLDCTPNQLAAKLANSYLEIKAAGVL